jgi:hypothetical protein
MYILLIYTVFNTARTESEHVLAFTDWSVGMRGENAINLPHEGSFIWLSS